MSSSSQSIAGKFINKDRLSPIFVAVTGQSNISKTITIQNDVFPQNAFLFNGSFNALGNSFDNFPQDVITNVSYMAKELSTRYPNAPIYFVSIGKGGESITSWLPNATDDIYAAFKSNVEAALSLLELPKIDMFIFWQGEQDGLTNNQEWANQYGKFEDRLKSEDWFDDDTPQFLFRINDDVNSQKEGAPKYNGLTTINSLIEFVCSSDPNKTMVDTRGLVMTDNLHSDFDDMKKVGKMFINSFNQTKRLNKPKALNFNSDLSIWQAGEVQEDIGNMGRRYGPDGYYAFNNFAGGLLQFQKMPHNSRHGVKQATHYAQLQKLDGPLAEFGFAYLMEPEILQKCKGKPITATFKISRGSAAFQNDFKVKASLISTHEKDGSIIDFVENSFDGSILKSNRFYEYSVTIYVPLDTDAVAARFEVVANETSGPFLALQVSEPQILQGKTPQDFEPCEYDLEIKKCERFYTHKYVNCSGLSNNQNQGEIAQALIPINMFDLPHSFGVVTELDSLNCANRFPTIKTSLSSDKILVMRNPLSERPENVPLGDFYHVTWLGKMFFDARI